MSTSYRFSDAIVRSPGQSIARGLRAADTGNPDPQQFDIQHRAYIAALENAGVTAHILPPQEQFPDSVFIEDTALCLSKGAVIMRPAAASRAGETAMMAAVLSPFFDDIRHIDDGGFIEGGDVLVTESEIIVGLSSRTDMAGAERLKGCVSPWGYTVRVLETPPEILHFKTACSLLDEETILLTKGMAAMEFFQNYCSLVVPNGEEAAANAIRVNDYVFISTGFPKTAELLAKAGYRVVALATGEAAKVDGGLSCLSLRFESTRQG